MSIKHRRIPVLPSNSQFLPFEGVIKRSYPVGKSGLTRAFHGEFLSFSISSDRPFPSNTRANLVTTINSNGNNLLNKVAFTLSNESILECNIIPKQSGVHSFRVEFSTDNGRTWIWDNVAEAMVLVDPPQVEGLLLYTLIPSVSGSIEDWKKELKRVSGMGFNGIHLLPITPLDESESPYSAKDLFDIDPSHLVEGSDKSGLSQLEEFIEEARKLGIRLCFDIVLNHVGATSTIAKKAKSWIIPDPEQPDGLKRAGFWSEHGWEKWEDLVLINYDHPQKEMRSEIWSYMTDYALFWAKYANETGGFIRFDNLHSSNPGFVKSLSLALHKEFPDLGILAEFFTDESTLLETTALWGLNLNLATPWNYKFAPQVRDYLKYLHRVSSQVRYFMPVTSHDSGTPAQEFGSADSTIPRYVAAALMGNGATGITQGVEFGEKERIDFIGRKKKIEYPAEARFAAFISQVNTILKTYPAFRTGGNLSFIDNGHHAVIAAFRSDPGKKETGFLVACNFDTGSSHHFNIELSAFIGSEGPYSFKELLSNETGIFNSSNLDIRLEPFGAKVLMLSVNHFQVNSPPA